jgi:hypothetical protein
MPFKQFRTWPWARLTEFKGQTAEVKHKNFNFTFIMWAYITGLKSEWMDGYLILHFVSREALWQTKKKVRITHAAKKKKKKKKKKKLK